MSAASSACILVVAPPSLCQAYTGAGGSAHGPLRCVARAGEMMQQLASAQVAAVVCHESPAVDQEALNALARWYRARRKGLPLLAVVTDLAEGGEKSLLHACAALHFSRYHSRPHEIIALLQQWAFPDKKKSKG